MESVACPVIVVPPSPGDKGTFASDTLRARGHVVKSTFRLGRIAGIQVGAHWSVFAVAG